MDMPDNSNPKMKTRALLPPQQKSKLHQYTQKPADKHTTLLTGEETKKTLLS
jgi:hypothetical protein